MNIPLIIGICLLMPLIITAIVLVFIALINELKANPFDVWVAIILSMGTVGLLIILWTIS